MANRCAVSFFFFFYVVVDLAMILPHVTFVWLGATVTVLNSAVWFFFLLIFEEQFFSDQLNIIYNIYMLSKRFPQRTSWLPLETLFFMKKKNATAVWDISRQH